MTSTFSRSAAFACAILAATHIAGAAESLRFADIFADNMVLQRRQELKCWGWAEPGSKVEVLLTQSA